MQQHNVSLQGWRQNIPVRCPARSISDHVGEVTCVDDGGLVDLINLVDLNMKEFGVGVEI